MNFNRPHRRFNPLTGQWVLVSPHRAHRPWQGQVEKIPSEQLPQYDPSCYLCPGNQRSSGIRNDPYTSTFVFDNDFASLLPVEEGEQAMNRAGAGLLVAEPEGGICRVVCFSPHHDLSLPEMPVEGIEDVITTWTDETVALSGRADIHYVQVFENKGALMGCSNPHPHSQIWATGHIPNEPAVEAIRQEAYLQEHGSCLLCEYVAAERADRVRIVAENDEFIALIPFWAIWPFEILLVSSRHVNSLPDLSADEKHALADILQRVTTCYDNLFEISFPYSMGFHQVPCDGREYPGWHLHAHYYPPLLRSASVRKFMVGFEMLGMPQRDLTPETAAERLRSLDRIHYKFR